MAEDYERCSTSRCRNIPVVEIDGKVLCQTCWEKLCDKHTKEKIKLYRKMGLDVCLCKTGD